MSPPLGAPSTAAIDPENTHGCHCASDFSRPGCGHSRERDRALSYGRVAPMSGDADAEQTADAESHRGGETSEQQHAHAGTERAASGEQRQRGADGEQRQRSQQSRLIGRAREPAPKTNGSNGIAAPTANESSDDTAAPPGRAQLVGVEAELLAGERVERVLRVGDELAWRRRSRFAARSSPSPRRSAPAPAPRRPDIRPSSSRSRPIWYSNSSRCERTETNSPAAIANAPAVQARHARQQRPLRRRCWHRRRRR